jgi:uncharacterized protein (TIGR02996 family)
MDETEEHLLDAVLADPDADAPRLAYADYCEQTGDAARAEFIRLGLRIALGRHTGRSHTDQMADELTLDSILAKHREHWSHSISGKVNNLAFNRGFIEACTLSAAAFCQHGDKIRLFAPIRHWTITEAKGWTNAVLEQVALRQAVSLIINRAEWGDEDALLVAECPSLGSLRRLDLSVNRIGRPGALAIVRSANLKNLRQLLLRRNPFDPNIITELNDDGAISHQELSPAGKELEAAVGIVPALHFDEGKIINNDWFNP